MGFAVFVVAMFSTYVTAINDFRKRSQYLLVEYKQALACAIAVQTFVLAYGLTGNCLYDLTVFAYFISCAVSLSIHYALRRIKLQNRKYKGFMQNESNATIY